MLRGMFNAQLPSKIHSGEPPAKYLNIARDALLDLVA